MDNGILIMWQHAEKKKQIYCSARYVQPLHPRNKKIEPMNNKQRYQLRINWSFVLLSTPGSCSWGRCPRSPSPLSGETGWKGQSGHWKGSRQRMSRSFRFHASNQYPCADSVPQLPQEAWYSNINLKCIVLLHLFSKMHMLVCLKTCTTWCAGSWWYW